MMTRLIVPQPRSQIQQIGTILGGKGLSVEVTWQQLSWAIKIILILVQYDMLFLSRTYDGQWKWSRVCYRREIEYPIRGTSLTQFSQEWARRKVVVKHSIKASKRGKSSVLQERNWVNKFFLLLGSLLYNVLKWLFNSIIPQTHF